MPNLPVRRRARPDALRSRRHAPLTRVSGGAPLPLGGAEVGKAFSQHYYNTFDTNRVQLQTLYQEGSMLSFENEQFMGMQSIMTKLTVCGATAARPRARGTRPAG